MYKFNRVFITRGLIVLLSYLILNFTISLIRAEQTAISYLRVLSIYNQTTYNTYRADLYKITCDEVFSSTHVYSGTVYPRIDYRVKSIKCTAIKGFQKFDFKVSLNINDTNIINCIITVDCNRVVDAHREDD